MAYFHLVLRGHLCTRNKSIQIVAYRALDKKTDDYKFFIILCYWARQRVVPPHVHNLIISRLIWRLIRVSLEVFPRPSRVYCTVS